MFTLRSNAVALTALAVALTGSTYALTALPKNSIGSKQIKPGAVHKSDIAGGAVTSGKIRNGTVGAADLAPGLSVKGDTGAQGPAGAPGPAGAQGAKGAVGPTQGFANVVFAGSQPPNAPEGNLSSTTISTSTAGRLFVFGRGAITVTCTAGSVRIGLFVDNVPVAASGQPLASGVAEEAAMFGLSEPVAAGDHSVTIKRQCLTGAFTSSSSGGGGALGAILLGG